MSNDNRRETYRFTFPPGEAPRIEVLTGRQRALSGAVLINLSLGGVLVRAPAGHLQVGDAVVVRLQDRTTPTPVRLNVSVPAVVAYLAAHGDDALAGLHFLPAVSPAATSLREALLSHFIVEEQRRITAATRR
jgi:hypothetical protein